MPRRDDDSDNVIPFRRQPRRWTRAEDYRPGRRPRRPRPPRPPRRDWRPLAAWATIAALVLLTAAWQLWG